MFEISDSLKNEFFYHKICMEIKINSET